MKQFVIRKVVPVVGAVAVIGGGALFGGEGSLPGDDVEREVRTDYAVMGEPLGDVDCDDLDAEAGATATCRATTTSGATQRLRARVSSVDGSTVKYDVARIR